MARISLTRSIKFRLLVKELGIPEPHVRGHLEYMWDTAHQAANPVLATPEIVEMAAGWVGVSGQLATALEKVGFLEMNEHNQLSIHDYWEHCPDYVRKRRVRAEKARADAHIIEQSGQRRTTADDGSRFPPTRQGKARQGKASTPDLSTNVGGNQHLPANAPADRSMESELPRIGEPRTHTNTPTEIDLLVDYETEVLNKLDGITNGTERTDRPALLKIARHVPRSIVSKALADTQDAKQRGQLDHPGKYFSARVTTLCATSNIRSPFAKTSEVTIEDRTEATAARAP